MSEKDTTQVKTFEELEKQLLEDPKMREEFLKDESKFIKVIEDEEAKKSDEDKEIDPAILGTYGKNRSIPEAVAEMAKGVAEKDVYIEKLKNQKAELESKMKPESGAEYEKLSERLKRIEEGLKEKPAEDKPDFKLDLGVEDVDLFTDEGKEKLIKSISALSERNKLLEKEIGNIKGTVDSVKEKTESVTAIDAVKKEIEEIDGFRKTNSTLFESKRSIEEIEKDYISFAETLAGELGVSVYQEDGTYSPAVETALNEIVNKTDKGNSLATVCKSKGVELPEDYGDLTTIYNIRKIRETTFEKDKNGNVVPISYEKAAKIFSGFDVNAIEQRAMEKLKAEKLGHEQAVKEREKFAHETKAEHSAGIVNINEYPESDFEKIVKKSVNERTDEEKAILKQGLDYMKDKGLTEEEIKMIIGG